METDRNSTIVFGLIRGGGDSGPNLVKTMAEVKDLGAACAVAWLVWSGACARDTGNERRRRALTPPAWLECQSLQTRTPYDAFFQHGDANLKLALAGEVSDVLESLSASRERASHAP